MHPIALLGAALPAALAFAWLRLEAALGPPSSFAPLLALVGAIPIALWIRKHAALLLLGFALSAVAVAAVLRIDLSLLATQPWSAEPPWVFVDLTAEPLPTPVPRWISARGFAHSQATLGEYDVPLGSRPDQSHPPIATLLPLLPQRDASALDPKQPIVIARVREVPPASEDPLILRGQTRPLPRELLASLVEIPADAPVHGVLLDTIGHPRPRDAWLALLAALLAVALASLCYTVARRP